MRERAANGGVGFGSLDWRRSETMRRVKELPANAPIYSNARDAIYILTGRVTRWIPAPVNAETREPRQDYLSRIEEMRTALRAEGASLVWFDRVDWRWYLPNRPALHRRLPVRRVSNLLDGEVWGYDPSRTPPTLPRCRGDPARLTSVRSKTYKVGRSRAGRRVGGSPANRAGRSGSAARRRERRRSRRRGALRPLAGEVAGGDVIEIRRPDSGKRRSRGAA